MSAALAVALALVAGAPPAAAEAAPIVLPPMSQRPAVVVDRIKNAGLLLPSVQETVKAVVLALSKRYGQGFVVMEDEFYNLGQLRRMSRGMKMPEEQDRGQLTRLAFLEWANQEAPMRVRATFVFDKKRKAYVSAAECHKRGSTDVIHRVEGVGKTYDAAVQDLEPQLKSFCAVLDAVAQERQRGGAPR